MTLEIYSGWQIFVICATMTFVTVSPLLYALWHNRK